MLQNTETAIESAECTYLLASSLEEEDEAEEDIEELLITQEVVDSYRYLPTQESGGRYSDNSLEGYIHDYPEAIFLALFRMRRPTFWQLVDVLTKAGGAEYWCQNPVFLSILIKFVEKARK